MYSKTVQKKKKGRTKKEKEKKLDRAAIEEIEDANGCKRKKR